jgi:hypothetical protein
MLFWLANALTLVGVLGPRAVIRYWDTQIAVSASATVAISFSVVAFLLLGALLVTGLSTTFQGILQGRYLGPPFGIFLKPRIASRRKLVEEHRQLVESLTQTSGTADALAKSIEKQLTDAVRTSYAQTPPLPAPGDQEHAAVEKTVRGKLASARQSSDFQDAADELGGAYTKYLPIRFEPLHNDLIVSVKGFAADLRTRLSEAAHERNERYPAVSWVAPTEYGSALSAADHYVADAYGIESFIFWSRLQKVIPADFMTTVRDTKVRLDFFTAMTMFAGLYGAIWVVLLPQLHPEPGLWLALVVFTLAATVVLYRSAVASAFSFGELFRACFDLFRRDLLTAMAIKPPDTLNQERENWQQLSRMMVFGRDDGIDLVLEPRKPAKAVFE